jgi:hypothetical protein
MFPSCLSGSYEVSVVPEKDTGENYKQKVDDDEKHPDCFNVVLLLRII